MTSLAVARGTREAFGEGLLAVLERRDTRVESDRREENAVRDELCDELRREGAAGARHFRATRLQGKHGLVRVERPPARDVAVADGPAVPEQVVLKRLVELESCDGQSFAAGEAGEQLDMATAEEVEPITDGRPRVRRSVVCA